MNEAEALKLIDKLASLADQDEKDEKWSRVYRVAHANNPNNSCYAVHEDWRKESEELAKSLENI